MPLLLDQLAMQLTRGGLLSADEVATLRQHLPDADGERFLRELVRRRKLTAYQAEQAYSGQARSLVLGNYVILDKLGQGGMGMVLKARHRRMDRIVALKVLAPAISQRVESLQRFQREVKAAAKLEHPNIVSAYDADEANGTHFFVMQYVEGRDLSSVVKSDGPLPVERAIHCVAQAARGLEFAHRRGVIHRDIKPANLLLDSDGTVKILDMGLARIEGDTGAQAELTGTGQVMGTVDYMAPEQALDTKSADARSDIYSLGITLWYLLVGRPAYDGRTITERLLAHQGMAIPSLIGARGETPAEVDAVFRKMVAKRPGDRYQTMTEVLADLESLQRGGPAATSATRVTHAESEDSQFHEFLAGLAQTTPPSLGVKPSQTVLPDDSAHTLITTSHAAVTQLPRVTAPRPAPASRTWWRDRRALSGVVVAGLLLLGVMVFTFTRQGNMLRRGEIPTTTAQELVAQPEAPAVPSPATEPNTPRATGWHGWPNDAPKPAIAPFDAVQAKRHQAEWAAYLKLPAEYTNSLGMKFVLVPPGEFMMGSMEAEIEALLPNIDPHWKETIRSEGPRHKVVLTQAIYLGIHEVTQQDYEAVMPSNPSHFSGTGPGKAAVANLDTRNHPMDQVTWNNAAEFCIKLSGSESRTPCYVPSGETFRPLDGTGYRLPTEAEWEFACRAGTTTAYWSGDQPSALPQAGWFVKNAGNRTHAVGELAANPWGLYDVHGNVWEWVEDGYDRRSYDQFAGQPALNPRDPLSAGAQGVIRGGDWYGMEPHCRSAVRLSSDPIKQNGLLGFRVALTVAAMRTSP
jgi:serine/threonine protein kinase/formylglycine-generating enzyme required for sulfatase activity